MVIVLPQHLSLIRYFSYPVFFFFSFILLASVKPDDKSVTLKQNVRVLGLVHEILYCHDYCLINVILSESLRSPA